MAIKMWKIVVYFVINSTDCQVVDVYFLLACRKVTTSVIAILSQSSGEFCGPLVGLLFRIVYMADCINVF